MFTHKRGREYRPSFKEFLLLYLKKLTINESNITWNQFRPSNFVSVYFINISLSDFSLRNILHVVARQLFLVKRGDLVGSFFSLLTVNSFTALLYLSVKKV